jgi:hypothetical protein
LSGSALNLPEGHAYPSFLTGVALIQHTGITPQSFKPIVTLTNPGGGGTTHYCAAEKIFHGGANFVKISEKIAN